MRFRFLGGFLAALLLVLLSNVAAAQTKMVGCGSNTISDLGIVLLPGQECYVLGHHLGSASGVQIGPLKLAYTSNLRPSQLGVYLVRANTDCEPGTFTIDYAFTANGDPPGVWQTWTQLTGVGSGLVSGHLESVVPGPVWRATWATITDPDCDTAGPVGTVAIVFIVGP